MTRGNDGSFLPLPDFSVRGEPQVVIMRGDGSADSLADLSDDELAAIALMVVLSAGDGMPLPTELIRHISEECGRRADRDERGR